MNSTDLKDPEILKELDGLRERIIDLERREAVRVFNNTHTNTNTFSQPAKKAVMKNLAKPIFGVFVFTMVLMTIYEVVKQWVSPNITIWTSHTITIMFASIIAPIGAYFALRQIEFHRQKALIEIGERQKAEHALQRAHDILEHRVEERTSQLSKTNDTLKKEINMRMIAEEELRKYTEQLLVSKEQLEIKATELATVNSRLTDSERKLTAINRSKDKFFSILAHDLRSPFTSLLGLSEFLENEIDSLHTDEIRKIVINISTSSKKVFKLLENLLQWSRVQTGGMEFNPEMITPYEIAMDIIELYKVNAAKKEINLVCDLDADVKVYGDKYMFETILRNLLSNAVKFTGNGGKITLESEVQNDDLIIKVCDTGIGIPEDEIKNLFLIDNNTTRMGTENEKGTGLGLVLCKEFVEKNGGKIEVKSVLNEGSCFNFTVPVKPGINKSVSEII